MTDDSTESHVTYDLISRNVVSLSCIYAFYQSVFKSEETIEQMGQISVSLFALIQESLQQDIIRLICSLTDVPGNGVNKNATILRMLGELALVDQKCSDRCQRILDDISDSLQKIRAHRNKRFVHLDLKTRLFKNEKLPKMLLGDVDSVVDGICRIMEEASPAITKTSTSFHDITQFENPSASMIWMIDKSLRFRKLWTLAQKTDVSDRTIRQLVSEYSDRNDEIILDGK